MKTLKFFFLTTAALLLAACNDNGNDPNKVYYQAEVVNHATNIDKDESDGAEAYASTSMYEIAIDKSKGTADIAFQVQINKDKVGTVILTDVAAQFNDETQIYTFRQTSSTISMGSYAVYDFIGQFDINQSGYSKTYFNCYVENHYAVLSTLRDIPYSNCKSNVEFTELEKTQVVTGEYIFTINPLAGTANVTMTNPDSHNYAEVSQWGDQLTYEGLQLTATAQGYKITGSDIIPQSGNSLIKKYMISDFVAEIDGVNSYDINFTIKDLCTVTAHQ